MASLSAGNIQSQKTAGQKLTIMPLNMTYCIYIDGRRSWHIHAHVLTCDRAKASILWTPQQCKRQCYLSYLNHKRRSSSGYVRGCYVVRQKHNSGLKSTTVVEISLPIPLCWMSVFPPSDSSDLHTHALCQHAGCVHSDNITVLSKHPWAFVLTGQASGVVAYTEKLSEHNNNRYTTQQ